MEININYDLPCTLEYSPLLWITSILLTISPFIFPFIAIIILPSNFIVTKSWVLQMYLPTENNRE